MKKEDLGSQSVEELQLLAKDLDKQIFDLRNELSLNRKLDKPHLLKTKRREKARVLTLLTLRTKKGAAA